MTPLHEFLLSQVFRILGSVELRVPCYGKKAIFHANGTIDVVYVSQGNGLIGDRTLVRDKLNKKGFLAFQELYPHKEITDICL